TIPPVILHCNRIQSLSRQRLSPLFRRRSFKSTTTRFRQARPCLADSCPRRRVATPSWSTSFGVIREVLRSRILRATHLRVWEYPRRGGTETDTAPRSSMHRALPAAQQL